MNQYGCQSMQGLPTLEQHNRQVSLALMANRKPAGVLCVCGTEMVFGTVNPHYNVSSGNPNCMCPGQSPNVICPACSKTGRKA